MTNLENFPEPELRDHIRTGIDAGIAAIPLAGGSIQVLADAVLAPSISKRRDAWLRKVGELLAELQAKVDGFSPEDLAGNEVFVTALADASRIAMGTHLEEKLTILKNCLLHLVADPSRGDFLDLQMFRFVDDLTPEHLLVLQYLANPGAWFDAKEIERPNLTMGAPMHLLEAAGLPVDGPSLQIVLRDLNDRGLASTESVGTTMTANGIWQGLASQLGMDLLDFISSV